jgi:hypothetical protein
MYIYTHMFMYVYNTDHPLSHFLLPFYSKTSHWPHSVPFLLSWPTSPSTHTVLVQSHQRLQHWKTEVTSRLLSLDPWAALDMVGHNSLNSSLHVFWDTTSSSFLSSPTAALFQSPLPDPVFLTLNTGRHHGPGLWTFSSVSVLHPQEVTQSVWWLQIPPID